jgi:hypothetical protein
MLSWILIILCVTTIILTISKMGTVKKIKK